MKNIRVIAGFLTLILVAAAFVGCSEAEVKTVDMPNQQEQGQQAPQNGRGTMAKVVSLNGDQLTVFLADMPRDARGGGNPPTDGTRPEGRTPPEGSNAPEGGPDQTGQPREGGGKIKFAEEKTSYPLAGEVTIMKGIGDAAAKIDLSELTVDDVIRFTTGTNEEGKEVIVAINVME